MSDRERLENLEVEAAALRQRLAESEVSEGQRRTAEQALSDAVWQWQSTFDALSDAVTILGTGGVILKCNRAFLTLVGKPSKDVIGRHCHDVVHGAAEAPEYCPIPSMKQTGGRAVSVYRLRNRWYRVTVDPMVDQDGAITGAVHVFSDITTQKEAEDRLTESEAVYRSLIETLPHAVGIYQDNKVVFVNQAAAAMFGYSSSEEMLGLDLTSAIPPDQQERLAAYSHERKTVSPKAHTHYFTDFVRRNGEEFPAEVFIGVITWHGRVAEQIVVIDISARRDLGR